MIERISQIRQGSASLAWILLILLLPLTSSPLLTGLAGASTVAPLSALPLAWLVLVWLIPYLLRRGTLSTLTPPLFGFVLVALGVSAYAFFIEIPPYRGKSLLPQEIPALLTLGAGLAFYLVTATWPRTHNRLRLTLQLVNISGLVLIAWSLSQAFVVVFLNGDFPGWMTRIQDWASVRGVFAVRVSGFPRLTGFAYEPSWLAHQLNLLYLPYWLAASVGRFSTHRRRLLGITLENALLAGGVVVLLFSFSRIGLLAFFLLATYLMLKFYLRWINALFERLADRFSMAPLTHKLVKAGYSVGMMALFTLVYLAGLAGLVNSLGRYDERMGNLFERKTWQADNFFTLTTRLAFAERAVYWATGWEIFNEHPFLGVGLGNAGFFFREKMPAYGWGLWETTRIFFHKNLLPNTKSMWVRILAETGLTGFAFFMAWLSVLWGTARQAQGSANPLIKTTALAGQLSLVGFLVEGFSIDSFALPYLWVATGLLTATVYAFQADEILNEPVTRRLEAIPTSQVANHL